MGSNGRLIILLVLILRVSPMKIIGHIGSVIRNDTDYVPGLSAIDSQFFMNTRAPADINGTITSIDYCFSLPGPTANLTFFQATIGFYRQQNKTFTLLSSIILTKTPSSLQNPLNGFKCEQLCIPSVDIQEGDVIGICQQTFTFSGSVQVGHMNFVANVGGENDTLKKMTSTGSVNACSPLGSLPAEVTNEELVESTQQVVLLLSADITSMDAPVLGEAPTNTTVEIATSVTAGVLLVLLLSTCMILVYVAGLLRKKNKTCRRVNRVGLNDQGVDFPSVKYKREDERGLLQESAKVSEPHLSRYSASSPEYADPCPILHTTDSGLPSLDTSGGSYSEVLHHYQGLLPAQDTEAEGYYEQPVNSNNEEPASVRFKLQKVTKKKPQYYNTNNSADPVTMQRNISYGNTLQREAN